MIDRALDAGVNFIDTANLYGRTGETGMGRSEEIIGQWIAKSGRRDEIVLATKVFGEMGPNKPNMRGSSRKHIIEQCDASLKRLQTDVIDIYQLHRPNVDIPIDESLQALDDLVRQGKIRYIGTSCFMGWELLEALWAAHEHGLVRIASEQPSYQLSDRRIERGVIPMARTYGIGLIPLSPLAGGALTGKYRRGVEPPKDARFVRSEDARTKYLFSEPMYRVIDVLDAIAAEKNATVTQVALAWCAQQPGITSPIIGPRTFEQLEDNLGAADVRLSTEDFSRLDEVAPPGEAVMPFHNFDTTPHRWPWIG
jgi:aryl-alcohol dehydrogenase-like predicted oxidoreductase